MRNIWRLFTGDVKRLTSNVVTRIILVGLIVIPSIFSWYNVLACWDAFGNTGNMKVAVSNSDAGYKSDLMPLDVNIGEQVVSALRANDQLNWTFTTEEDAVDGARSGRYYAAVVIPESFSRDMLTFYSDDVEHAQIVYYANEKKNAVSPHLTANGADQVSYQVNEVFTQTLTETALSIAEAVSNYADEMDASGGVATVAGHVSDVGAQLSDTAGMLRSYAQLADASGALVSNSSALLSQARDEVESAGDTASEGIDAAASAADAMKASAGGLSGALSGSGADYDAVASAVDDAYAQANGIASASVSQLRDASASAAAQVTAYRSLAEALANVEGQAPSEMQPAFERVIAQANAAADAQQRLADGLSAAADDLETGSADAQARHDEVNALVAQARASAQGLASDFDGSLKPSLEQLSDQVSDGIGSLAGATGDVDALTSDLGGASDSVGARLATAKQELEATADELDASSQTLSAFAQRIEEALASGDSDALADVLSADPETLASALAAPVQIDRQAVFAADNFGSQMSPLYTTLGLWVGSLLMLVAVKTGVSERARRNLVNPKPSELFLGRFGVLSVISLAQSTLLGVGNLLFVGVQVAHPLLYLVALWVTGLVFVFIIYTLVVSFANIGKAIAIFLLVIQVTAGGGSFALPLLPDFYQAMSPFLPATHAINAMRAAMMGIYENDYLIELVRLLAFLVPALLLGLLLRKPIVKLLDWYVAKVESSKIVA